MVCVRRAARQEYQRGRRYRPAGFSSLSWVPPRTTTNARATALAKSDHVITASQAAEQPARRIQPSPAISRNAHLAKQMELLVDKWRPSEDLIKQRDHFVWELRTYLASEIPGSTLALFGSAVTGLWLPHSDLDISIEVPGVRERSASLRVLKRAAAAIHRLTGDRAETRFTANVPIIRWESSSNRSGSAVCDISVNNSLAVANSRLLAQYVATDLRVRKLATVLKVWARARGINDRSQGTLSSFALTLMLIHFLQRRHVLPCLQHLAALRDEPPHEVLGLDCRFCSDPAAIAAAVAELRGRDDGECLASLLISFFRYFNSEYRGGAISVNATKVHSSDGSCADSSVSGKSFLMIENPFERGRDVANLEVGQILRVRQELRRAHRMLLRGRCLVDVCSDLQALSETTGGS